MIPEEPAVGAFRALRASLIVATAAASLVFASCGSDDSTDGDSASASTSTSTAQSTTTAAAATGLVGEWSTQNVCDDQVRALKEAGLDDLVSEWVEEYPGLTPTDTDPCRGAKPIEHSHGFGENGSFASYDQNGEQVDDGAYTPVDDRTFTLGDPPVTVHYRIDGDEATFDVVVPDCTKKACRESAAYVTSVFFPRTYERVR